MTTQVTWIHSSHWKLVSSEAAIVLMWVNRKWTLMLMSDRLFLDIVDKCEPCLGPVYQFRVITVMYFYFLGRKFGKRLTQSLLKGKEEAAEAIDLLRNREHKVRFARTLCGARSRYTSRAWIGNYIPPNSITSLRGRRLKVGSRNNYPCCMFDPIFTRDQFWPSGIVVACVRPSVRQSVRHQVCPRDNSSTV